MRSDGRRCWSERDGEAEPAEVRNGVPAGALGTAFGDLDGTGVEVGLAGVQDAVGSQQDLVSDGNHGASIAAPPAQLHIAFAQVGALGTGASAGTLHQGGAQPLRPLPGLAGAALAC